MKYELITQLSESQLVPNVARLNQYNLRDIADLAFLYIMTLEILFQEKSFKEFAMNYAYRTVKFGNFDNFMFSGTDLYVFLHILTGNNAAGSRGFLKDYDENMKVAQTMLPDFQLFRNYLRFMSRDFVTDDMSRRALLQIQFGLNIENSNYRNVRVLVSQWNKIPKESKKLAITRVLQAFRHRALRSELLPHLEALAKEKNLELKNVHNPETGELSKKTPAAPWWVAPAAFVGGAVAGYNLLRKRKDK